MSAWTWYAIRVRNTCDMSAELLRLRYGQRRIDLIITLYPEGLNFLLGEGQEIFPDAPVLALFLPQGVELRETGRKS